MFYRILSSTVFTYTWVWAWRWRGWGPWGWCWRRRRWTRRRAPASSQTRSSARTWPGQPLALSLRKGWQDYFSTVNSWKKITSNGYKIVYNVYIKVYNENHHGGDCLEVCYWSKSPEHYPRGCSAAAQPNTRHRDNRMNAGGLCLTVPAPSPLPSVSSLNLAARLTLLSSQVTRGRGEPGHGASVITVIRVNSQWRYH